MSHPRWIDRCGGIARPWFRDCLPPFSIFLLTLALPSALPITAQSSDTLGTKLTLTGNVLDFRWDAKHPWSGQMSASGVQLFAEYVTPRQGRVVEKLDTSRPVSAKEFSVTLRLPDSLQAVPQGNVCLYLQVAGGRRIPLRKPKAGNLDTEHFAVPAWDAVVAANSAGNAQQAKLQAMQAAVTAAEATLQADEAKLREKGWTDTGSCDRVTPPSFAPASRPADVLPAGEQEAAARRVCMRRVLTMRQPLSGKNVEHVTQNLVYAASCLPDPATDAALLQYLRLQKGVDQENLHLREAEYLKYKADWQQWKDTVEDDIRRNVTPMFGKAADHLEVQDVTAAVGLEIMNFSNLAMPVLDLSRKPAVQDVAGYLGGGLETYSRCVVDGQKELAAKLKAWTEQVARAPMLEGIAKGQLRAQCLSNLDGVSKRKQELHALEQQLETERRVQPSAAHPASPSQQTTALNQAACTVR